MIYPISVIPSYIHYDGVAPFWSGSMSKCRRQAIFYNLSDFNCFKHVRATSLSFLPHPHTTSHICLSNSQCVCVCINVYKSVCNSVCECVCLASFLALSTLFHVEKIGEQEPGNSRQTLTSSLQTSWWPPLPPTYTPPLESLLSSAGEVSHVSLFISPAL